MTPLKPKRRAASAATPPDAARAWPADAPERRAVAELVPFANNARTHSDAQVAQIAASIREWGFTNPVLIDEHGLIIAGHGRVLAARKLQIAEVPCLVARGWTEAQKRAYVIADNKVALNAGWDADLLAVELGALGDLGFDATLTGFSADEIAALADSLAEPDAEPNRGEGAGGGEADAEDETESLVFRLRRDEAKAVRSALDAATARRPAAKAVPAAHADSASLADVCRAYLLT